MFKNIQKGGQTLFRKLNGRQNDFGWFYFPVSAWLLIIYFYILTLFSFKLWSLTNELLSV